MFYPKNQEKELSDALFQNPTAEYRGAPFWAWNCELDAQEMLRQIDVFETMGFGGFHMHVRTGMDTKYLSDEFMGYIRTCVDRAKEKGMLAYLYDEDRWPSGAAGGYVTKDHQNRQRFLRFCPQPHPESSQLVACYDLTLDENGCLASYCRIGADEQATGQKWYAYLEITEDQPWFNNQAYLNTLDKKAVDRFIDITYTAYENTCAEEFGKTVPSIFTDEPQVFMKSRLGYANDQANINIPWTDDLPQTFLAAYGEDLLDGLPEVFWNLPEGKPSSIRYHYHDHVCERFATAFSDNCGKWCREHGLMLTGHMMEEPTLFSQTRALGEAMRHYRAFDLPGIDMLKCFREFTTAKQVQSAVHQYGREAMMSELYGITGWHFDLRNHKLHGDWQAALGVTLRVPHLSWMSMKGEAKRDYPASINYQAPWFEQYKHIEDHFSRVHTALSRGVPTVRIGVVHPIESFWLQWGPNEQNGELMNQLNQQFLDLTDWLVKGLVDFDFICESLLPEQCTAGSNPLQVGKMQYDVVVVPPCQTLRSTTLERLESFRAQGGRLIFMGAAPALENAKYSPRGKALFDQSEQIGFTRYELLHTLEQERAFTLHYANGNPATERYCHQLRRDGDKLWLFLAPAVEPKSVDVPETQSLKLSLKGIYPTVKLYDTMTGEIKPMQVQLKNGNTVLSIQLCDFDSLLLCFSPQQSQISVAQKQAPQTTALSVPQAVSYTLSEPNVCLLDLAEYRLDGEEYAPEEEILRLDNQLRTRLGLPLRGELFAQPWVVEREIPKHTVSLRFTVYSEIEVSDAKLALEDATLAQIRVNGVSVCAQPDGWYVDKSIQTVAIPTLHVGENIIEVTLPFGSRTNTEWCYLLGDFGVRVSGKSKALTALPKTLQFGSVTHQGLPFYGGNLTYHIPIKTNGGKLCVETPHYTGAMVTCRVAEQQQPIIIPPYRSELELPAGEHTVDLTVYGTRYNSFGPVHLFDRYFEWGVWPSSWRSEGAAWTYEYCLKEHGLTSAPEFKEYKKD